MLVYLAAVTSLAGVFFVLDLFKRRDLVSPRTVLANIDLGGMSQEEVVEIWRSRWEEFQDKPLSVAALGEVKTLTVRELNVRIDEEDLLKKIPFTGKYSNAELLFWGIAGQRIVPQIYIEPGMVMKALEEKFPQIPKTKNAKFVLEGKEIKIMPAENGYVLKADDFSSQIINDTIFFDSLPLFARYDLASPTVSQADLEANRQAVLAEFPQKIIFQYEAQKWTADFSAHPDWIIFEGSPFSMAADPVAFSNFLENDIAKSLEQSAEFMRIWRDPDGGVKFEGHDREGRAIDRELLLARVNGAIKNKQTEVSIPLKVVKPPLEISPDLQQMGIFELIGVGYTKFEGSPQNRKHNIGIGIAKFDGLIIQPGETFSFNKNLGPVDASTGYKKELVIKPEGTVPEFGGGLCQVSTTIYRAAIYAGLPIVERKAHKYAVSYYAQAGGHGLDATVYSPSPDLKFTNDTPGAILIHSFVEGSSAYFKFYGTADGRKVALDGPYVSNRRGAPAEPMIIADPTLAAGERKQVEKPHGGFDAIWYRTITNRLGETVKETIVSKYQAVPAKFLVGGQVTPAGENSALQDQPNPFE